MIRQGATDRHFEATPGDPDVEYLGALLEACVPVPLAVMPECQRATRGTTSRFHVGTGVVPSGTRTTRRPAGH